MLEESCENQPSLLREVDLSKPVPRRYDLGMDDFVESEAFEKRKQNLPLSLKRTRARTAGAATEAAPTKRRCLAAISNNADRFDFSKHGDMLVRCACSSSVSRAPAKQDDAAASMTFSTRFDSVANCVINVNVGGQAPKLNN